MISLIVPCCGGSRENLYRTRESTKGWCNELLIISTALFYEDLKWMKDAADRLIALPWNYIFVNGYGDMSNQATGQARNDWLMLLGVAETIAEPTERMKFGTRDTVYRCNHVNDVNTWKRIWNRSSDSHWSGIIHEEIVGGFDGGVIFRMQDTAKTPEEDPFKNECMRRIKVLSYNWQYYRLLNNSGLLGGTDRGWLEFVNGARESIEAFFHHNEDLIDACVTGDLNLFLNLVHKAMEDGRDDAGISFKPQGQ